MSDGVSEVYDPALYGERIAGVYDDWYSALPDCDAAVDVLAELAGGGRELELGIGTGRIALPLAARGVPVVGIDASPAMVDKLRAKPGGHDIDIGLGLSARWSGFDRSRFTAASTKHVSLYR